MQVSIYVPTNVSSNKPETPVHGTLIDSACKIEHYNEDTYLNKFNKEFIFQAGVKNIHLHTYVWY